MRLVPFMLAIFVLAIRFKAETRLSAGDAGWRLPAVGFLLVRIAGTTASLAIAANHQAEQLDGAR